MSRILLVFFLFIGTHAICQDEGLGEQRDFNFSDWRVGFQMNGPNNWGAAVNFIKPIHPKWALRLGFHPIISFNRTLGQNPNQQQYVKFEEKSKNLKWGANLSFGGEFHPISNGKIDPYVFTGVGMGGFTEVNKRTTAYELQQPQTNGLIESERLAINKGAPSVSLNPFGGFGVNYYFHVRLAFGVEYAFSPNMNLVLGWRKSETTLREYFEDGTIQEQITNDDSRANAFFLNLNQQIGFHMIYVLSKN